MIKPILFNTDMVLAILDGHKTVTRRVVKPQPQQKNQYFRGFCMSSTDKSNVGCASFSESEFDGYDVDFVKVPYHPGDVLWVRETWADYDRYYYKATEPDAAEPIENSDPRWFKWHPSIHMPKEAARLFLRVTDVRVERLQDIRESGARAEGFMNNVMLVGGSSACKKFSILWDSTIKPADLPRYGWDANPWVWVVEFERCEKPAGWPGEAGEGGE